MIHTPHCLPLCHVHFPLCIVSYDSFSSHPPDKDKWIETERIRWAELFHVPICDKTPEGFPPMTLTIMRSLCALTLLHPGKEGQGILIKALDALFEAFWISQKSTHERDVLEEILGVVLGREEAQKGKSSSLYLVSWRRKRCLTVPCIFTTLEGKAASSHFGSLSHSWHRGEGPTCQEHGQGAR